MTKHSHQTDFRCCLWIVDRSTADLRKGRGPRLRFCRILRQGPKAVLLDRSIGQRLYKRADLNGNKSWLCETPLTAVMCFGQRAEGWRERALADAAWAGRDLAFVEHRPLAEILRYAKENT